MAKVTVYNNSKFATVLSFLGYLMMVCGIYCLFNDLAGAGVIVLVLGFGLKLLAGFISKKKSQKNPNHN